MIIQSTLLSKLIIFMINVTGIALIITILAENIRPIIKKIFVAMVLLMFMWVNLAFLARIVEETEIGLIFIRIAWSITPLLFIFIYAFIINFIGVANKYRYFTYFSYAIGILFVFLTALTTSVIKGIGFVDGVLTIEYGNLVWIFFGIIAFYTIVDFYLLIKYYNDESVSDETKERIRTLLVGLSLLFVANALFNITAPLFFGIFHLYEFGDYSTIVFMVIIAYAIVQRRFFDVKVVGTSFLVAFLGVFILGDALIFSESLEQRLARVIIFVIYVPFGYMLIKSVIREVGQRQKLQELTDKLQALHKQKDEFISMAAHELRAPLTAVKGYVSMLVEGDAGELPEKARGFLADTGAVTDRMIRLVNNMLNVARIEGGRIVFQMEESSVIKAVQESYYSFRFEAERKGIDLNLSVPDGVNGDVYADPDRLREVVGNFVSNAIKYTEKGSVEIRISQPTDQWVKVEVIDTGPGITEAEQKKLFQKFYRAESTAGKTIGTGLGLYISRLYIEHFKGKIGISSKVDQGSDFWFELPISTKGKADG